MVLDLGLISLTCLQIEQLRKDLELSQNGQTMLIDKLIACCKEVRTTPVNRAYPLLPFVRLSHTCYLSFSGCFRISNDQPNAERTQRLFASLREELEKRGTKFAASGD